MINKVSFQETRLYFVLFLFHPIIAKTVATTARHAQTPATTVDICREPENSNK
jgi:hypothetical protein